MKHYTLVTLIVALATIDAARVCAQEISSGFDFAHNPAVSRENTVERFDPANDIAVSQEEIPSHFDLAPDRTVSGEEEVEADSLVHESHRRLLPPNMSIMEKWLWGENGLMRETGIVGPLSPQERKSELNLRRTMLTTHQIGGFVTLVFMWSAAYFGQKIVDGHPEYRRNHQYAVTGTIITYSATGLLAVLSPPPLIRRDEVSTTTIHKTLAWVHAAGMILTPILGGMVMHRRSTNLQIEHFHQFSGYITTAVFTASMITVTF
jgi:hypothetical protein